MSETGLLAQARAIHEAARDHKRQEAFHRRRARERMEDLRRFCLRVGIAVQDIRDGGQNGHGRRDERS